MGLVDGYTGSQGWNYVDQRAFSHIDGLLNTQLVCHNYTTNTSLTLILYLFHIVPYTYLHKRSMKKLTTIVILAGAHWPLFESRGLFSVICPNRPSMSKSAHCAEEIKYNMNTV